MRDPEAVGRRRAAAVLLVALMSAYAAGAQTKRPVAAGEAKRVNELTLARLQPGKDTIESAERFFRREHRANSSRADAPEWADGCAGRFVRLELQGSGLVESITVSSLASEKQECRVKTPEWLAPQRLRTGRGLGLGAAKREVLRVYGPPQSVGPSTQSGRELELLYYAFDWAGPDVPQVMEVTLEKGRVVQITLAFPSL